MSRKRNYDETNVIRSLSRKTSCAIRRDSKTIEYDNTGTLGNSSWGKIDFLVNYCGYFLVKMGVNKDKKQETVNNNNTIEAIPANNFSMVNLTKNAMQNINIAKC